MEDLTIAEWADLGRRLKRLNKKTFDQVVTGVREVLEAEEVLSRHDSDLVLRPRRPTKRYSA